MGVTLEYTGHTRILFEDRSYRWFSIKRFVWDGTQDDTAMLTALIGHWRYRDHYTSWDSHEQDAVDIHGPYRLGAITLAEFVSVGTDEAAAVVQEFCGLHDCQPRPEIREQIVESVLSWLGRSSWYRLRDLPEARHEFGWVLMEYRELVAISREPREVLLVVMAID